MGVVFVVGDFADQKRTVNETALSVEQKQVTGHSYGCQGLGLLDWARRARAVLQKRFEGATS